MENEQTEFTLPPAPRGLCFDRNDFIRTTFSVDSFLCDDQKSLETIRDDLGVYLKVLRLAMIELINKDYANFVNLSATLIGFDKAIEKIQFPLGQLNEEVMAVKECLDDTMKELSMWLNQRNALRKKKELLRLYSLTLNTLTVVKNVLNTLHDKHMREKIALVDRCAMQYNKLKFAISKCESLVKAQQKQEFIEIGDRLYDILDELLFYFWHENDEENLLNTLVTLSSLDRVAETEELIRNRAVAPHLAEIINESFLQKSQNGLKGIYNSVLILLDSKLKLLFTTMEHSNLSFLVRRYRFLINCFWYEVETRLEVNLASIFAPGNPKIFYMRYCESMKFMKRLETYCSDRETVNFLHRTSQYKSFMKRWNLPVYFQIRFQEIAGNFEASLQQSPTHKNENGFLIKETNCCWKAIEECWSDGIYIEALAHRFWKLSLQLISRYVTWVNTFCAQKPPKTDLSTICRDLIHDSVNIYLDIQTLLQRLPQFFCLVQSKINIHDKFGDILSDSLKSSQEILMMAQKNVRNSIVTEISGYFNAQLKQVSDIPRLYRKTKRSMPSKPCTYIDTIVRTAHELSQDSFQRLDSDYLVQLYQELFHSITSSYYKYVEDVLISVKKTEDSLRRLKQIRDGTPQQASETGVTDGEKIRLQLNVDVVAYGKLIESFKLDANNIEKFKELNDIVKEAVKNIEIK